MVPTDVNQPEPGLELQQPSSILDYLPLSTSSNYYTNHIASQSFSASSQFAFLSELTGMLHAGAAMSTSPPDSQVPLEVACDMTVNKPDDEDDNSDLEVVDVIKAKTRKPPTREPEVVELSDSDDSDAERSRAIDQELARQTNPTYVPPSLFNSEEPVVISSDEEEETESPETHHNYARTGVGNTRSSASQMRMRLNTLGTSNKTDRSRTPVHESSSDDDLIVVKTEHNTIDPITKKQIVEPVRNKKCSHVYEKSTIYSMIDLARENSKSVKCPYMGCNCKDFKKTDLVKDKEVLGHLTKVREEQEKAENEKKEEELRAREERKR